MTMQSKTRKLSVTAMLGAVASVLMFFEFSVPFMPSFIAMDISELPALLAAYSLGPVSGATVCLIKNLFSALFHGTTGGVGELADFLIMSSFSVVVGLIYSKRSDRKGVLMATLAGTVTIAIVGGLANRFLLIPFFSKVMPLEAIFAACAEINPAIDGLNAYIFFGAVPFNVIKGLLLTVLTFLLYRKLEGFLKNYIKP